MNPNRSDKKLKWRKSQSEVFRFPFSMELGPGMKKTSMVYYTHSIMYRLYNVHNTLPKKEVPQ